MKAAASLVLGFITTRSIAAMACLVLALFVVWSDGLPKGLSVEKLPIDGKYYVRGAERMLAQGDWVYTDDQYHSVGMQILTAFLYRFVGYGDGSWPVIVWNLILWLSIVYLGANFLHPFTKRVSATCLISLPLILSKELFVYVGLVQYEITVAWLCLIFCLGLTKPTRQRMFVAGVVAAVLCIFRVHFIVVVPLALFWIGLKRSHLPLLLALVVGYLLVAAPFNAYYSVRTAGVYFFQQNVTLKTLSQDLNENSDGRLYPYKKKGLLRGWPWVRKDPVAYLGLLWQRAEYLMGISDDYWSVKSRWLAFLSDSFARSRASRSARAALAAIGISFFALGLWRTATARLLVIPMITAVFPIIFINYSSRLFVPALPCFLLLVGAGLHILWIFLRDRAGSRKFGLRRSAGSER